MSRRSPPPPASGAPRGNPDDRPIRARGHYDLSFFDADNEFETYGVRQRLMQEETFQHDFQQLATMMASRDYITDDEFDREWSYERLLQLDERLQRRGGMPLQAMKDVLRPVRNLVGEECTICLERSVATDRMARLQCGHAFHCKCLQTWLADHCTCPNCRQDLRPAESDGDASGSGGGGGAAAGAPQRRRTPPPGT